MIYRLLDAVPEVTGGGAAPVPAMTGTAPAQLATISMKRAASGFTQARGGGAPRRMRMTGISRPNQENGFFHKGVLRE